ncbi:hypothetical protein [Streptomyces fulvorobeus]|uniref:Putative lipoprotein with Yx(FWY)xxD motif n=1 Tax=Streptomyces fulvorobeus TaxID=284028 RepID=A0A7Y9L0P4_9ACTN|nr:hypothetical protein [Streptomyces fulvorobeus]NYE44173.1 putative lipoprotein with Yx(FWY)xxD motif [Streptomyces fulvorobeus]
MNDADPCRARAAHRVRRAGRSCARTHPAAHRRGPAEVVAGEGDHPRDVNGQQRAGRGSPPPPEGGRPPRTPRRRTRKGRNRTGRSRRAFGRHGPGTRGHVADKRGRAVHRFQKDSAWPMNSARTDDCLKKWPAAEPVARNEVEGVITKGYVTSAARRYQPADSRRPAGLRLLRRPGPGAANGRGSGGTWYAVPPGAKPLGAPNWENSRTGCAGPSLKVHPQRRGSAHDSGV